jgi:predicted phosphohydrolase
LIESKKKPNWIEFKKINLVNKKIVLFFQRLRFSIGHNFTQPSLVLLLFYSPPPPSSSSIETEEERKRKKERKKGICIYGNLHGGGWGILASGTKMLSKNIQTQFFLMTW